MGSYQFRHGLSKSQMCLHKILHIIASYPSQEISKQSSDQVLQFQENNRGLGIDLNMELLPWPREPEESESLSVFSHDSAAERCSSEGECDHPKPVQEIPKESKDFLDQGGKASPEFQEEEKKSKAGDCFSLLVEAAGVVSGNLKDKEEKPPAEAKESEAAKSGGGPPQMAENISPVVRSKRGRSHVLPSRYRDSVVEPLKRPPRPQRPAASTIVSTKRGRFNNNNKLIINK